jgi:ankyrin repeat protein
MCVGSAAPVASSLLEAHQSAAAPRLQLLLDAALLEVCPTAAFVLRRPREQLRRTLASSGPDFSCHAPVAAWLHLRGTAAPYTSADADSQGAWRSADGLSLRIATRSPLGSLIVRCYANAEALAEAVLEALPSDEMRLLVADSRVTPGGSLLLTSRAFFVSLSATGRLHCPRCGCFFSGQRGLRDHVQVAHRSAYEESRSTVDAARSALVAYSGCADGLDAGLRALSLHAARAASAAAAARDALPAGLAAARGGDLPALCALLHAGTFQPASSCDRHGSSALMFAAGQGHLHVCRYLVDQCRVDPSAGQPDGRTALLWACRNGQLDVCRYLVDTCGVDAAQTTKDGTSGFHWAVWKSHRHVCAWLISLGRVDWKALNAYGCNAGQWAAQSGDVDSLAWLHAQGLDLGVLNHNGHSVLHKAAQKGRAEACDWLLRHAGLGKRHMRADSDGNTPARMAAAEGHAELAQWLQARAEEMEIERDGDCLSDTGVRGDNRLSKASHTQ